MGLAWWWLAWGVVIAIGMDLVYRYSPNRLHGLLAAGGMIYHLQTSSWHQMLLQGQLLLIMMGLAIGSFALGWLRGGDAKGLMAMSCWIDAQHGLVWLGTIALLAGVTAAGLLLNETLRKGLPWLLDWWLHGRFAQRRLQDIPIHLQVPLLYPIAIATWWCAIWRF